MAVVGTASSCAGGLAAVERYLPDVLLLDQRLPDGLGTEYVAAMLAACPPMKVLVVTAGDTDEVLASAVLAGAAGVIPKGKSAASLIKAILAVANDEAVITPDALRRLMPRLRRLFARAGLEHEEVNILRGILASTQVKTGHGRKD
jgi:DNA-binding NarL/FixJ family response regulator